MNARWRVASRGAALGTGAVSAGLALSQQTGTGVASATVSSPFVNVLQMLLALVVVLGLIALFAWLMRRMSQGQRLGGGALKVRGGVMLGPRERVVLLEVADTWIVVGVGGGQVNALHAMPRPANAEPTSGDPVASPTFSTWLQRAVGGGTKPRA